MLYKFVLTLYETCKDSLILPLLGSLEMVIELVCGMCNVQLSVSMIQPELFKMLHANYVLFCLEVHSHMPFLSATVIQGMLA